jgi:hypothetical protein
MATFNINYKLYKYESFDYGWGCGWRTLQNCISKLYNIEISIEEIMYKLKNKGYTFNNNHYGFLDGSMIIDFLKYYSNLDVNQIDIYNNNDINSICNIMKQIKYDNYKFCGIIIHDGYIVMINDIDNTNKLHIIDPHQNPNIKEFIKLNEIGHGGIGYGGIGWIDINNIIYKNIDNLGMTLNKEDYLKINTPTIYIIKLLLNN